MTKREQAFETLRSLNPAPVFLQSYQSKRLPENLESLFGPPEEFFLAEERHTGSPDRYSEGEMIAILDDGNFYVITYYDPTDKTLVQMDIESPGDILATFHNWQQYLAHLMMGIGEAVDDNARLQRIAELVDFHYMVELFDFFQTYSDSESWEDLQRRKNEFIDRIGGLERSRFVP